MTGSYMDISFNQGASVNIGQTLTDINGDTINLSNTSLFGIMKKSYYTSNVAATFDIVIINPSSGELYLTLNYSTTANICPGTYLYDVVMLDQSNNVTRIMEGQVYVNPGVTII